MTWTSSNRKQRLPANWTALRAECKRRAKGKCQAVVHQPECTGIGTDADHVDQGDDHQVENLQWLSRPCHDHKTRMDNLAGKRLTLPQERHPGRLR